MKVKFKVIDFKLEVQIFKNGVKSITLLTPHAKEVGDYIKGILPHDYFQYKKFYNLTSEPTMKDWVENVIKLHNQFSDTELFKGVTIISHD